MARVTVEDCVTIIPNRFELCLIANNRAKSILSGASTTLNVAEKPSVIALREIAEELVDADVIRKNIIDSARITRAGVIDDQSLDNAASIISDELENTVPLKDNIFLDDNLIVDD
jgi:DNA-directed RNA polymerase subunit omega